MKNFLLLLIFSMLSAGVMLSGISMRSSTFSAVVMLALCCAALLYLMGTGRKRKRY